MKALKITICLVFLFCMNIQAQTYQNTTATSAIDGINRLGDCGASVQPGVHMSTINIPITGIIGDPTKITFNLSLNATWLGDVAADIISPSGDAITLIRRIGTTANNSSCGDSSNFLPANVLSFNSANVNPIDAASLTDSQNIPAGNYIPTIGTAKYPTHNIISMSTFLTGKQINGDWTLVIYDYGAGDTSNISSWQIILNSGAFLKTTESGIFTSEIIVKENPVKDRLLLKLNDNDFTSLVLELYDTSGKLMRKESVPRQAKDFEMNASDWYPGMYLLIPIKDGDRKQAIKLLKK
ncbi:proprotein convertase P-domain-containing protein [Chryseobacterium herbae]|uniref:T9SS type A sorting domain-containing protein n=1 Tax=Chryseobacterium herbae TaxID=2976476 RepID=A0ABT2IQI9_9FLAO|nr:proprotein convertase P-domain-containing protein [Chryseobacterium sp. pc1-10]MCT2561047.1 T9SS type A sorting domain-containing protein [Chryseobacterium sp. pc1-10]